MCEESASFDLTSFDIASCFEDIDKCLEQVINQTENADMADGAGMYLVPNPLQPMGEMFQSKLLKSAISLEENVAMLRTLA